MFGGKNTTETRAAWFLPFVKEWAKSRRIPICKPFFDVKPCYRLVKDLKTLIKNYLYQKANTKKPKKIILFLNFLPILRL